MSIETLRVFLVQGIRGRGGSACLPAPIPTVGGAGRRNLKFEINLMLLQPQGPEGRSSSGAIAGGYLLTPYT